MKSRTNLAFLFLGAVSLFALPGGALPRQAVSGDSKKANQLREEKDDQLLTTLLGRCRTMLDMQMAVYNSTKGLYKVFEGRSDKKPRSMEQQAARQLSDKQKAIVAEATKAIDRLEAEGAAVAFPEVFQQLRKDMRDVQRRLEKCHLGAETQAIEKDIIDTLEEMIGALKK